VRCPSCNKFPSLDTGDPEGDIEGVEFDAESHHLTVHVSARLPVTSSCCGDEVKEGNYQCQAEADPDMKCQCDEFEADIEEITGTDRMETKDRRGKPINNPRFMRHMYGVEGRVAYSCECGATKGVAEFADEMQASAMDELV